MPPAKNTRGGTTKALKWYDTAEHLELKARVRKLEDILEHVLYDVKGERGEMLRKRFYEN